MFSLYIMQLNMIFLLYQEHCLMTGHQEVVTGHAVGQSMNQFVLKFVEFIAIM